MTCYPRFHGPIRTPLYPSLCFEIVNIMALKFAANISFAFQERENFLDRYQAAKNAGSVNGCVNLKKMETRKAR